MKNNGKLKSLPAIACCALLSATLLAGCMPAKEGAQAQREETRSFERRSSVQKIADNSAKKEPAVPQKTRDLLAEWEITSQSDSNVPNRVTLEPSPSPVPSETTGQNPKNPFGLPPASSKTSPPASSLPSSTPRNQGKGESDNREAFEWPGQDMKVPNSALAKSEQRIPRSVAVPTHEGLYFGMTTDQVLQQYANLPYKSGRDGLGQYLQITGTTDFEKQSGEATTAFYFDDENQLTAICYHYTIDTLNEETWQESMLDAQWEEWSHIFGDIGTVLHYDKENQGKQQSSSVFETLNTDGRVLGSWYGENIETVINLDNRADGKSVAIDICVQRGALPLVQLPESQILASYEVNELYDRYVENEIAAEYNIQGKFIQLQGKMLRITRDESGQACIRFESNVDGFEIRAVFPEWRIEQLLDLRAGETTMISGFLGKVERSEEKTIIALKNCQVLSPEQFTDNQSKFNTVEPDNENSPAPTANPQQSPSASATPAPMPSPKGQQPEQKKRNGSVNPLLPR